ncbi:hypothetical protein QR685DRAFT_433943 [Neurospora intermedia]|uniref:Uncharacterized protein n=1 Tax=Neurospora intermedia TaxID=5142 RepID=A0ABR3DS81_NEUIN
MAPFQDDIVATLRKANEELIESLQARLQVAEKTFLRLAPDAELRNAIPEGVISYITEEIKFPRHRIKKVYPVQSGFYIETTTPDQRLTLIELSKNIPQCKIELETESVSYYLAGVPLKFFAHNGARDTEPYIEQEVLAATRQQAKIIKAKILSDYIIVLPKKTHPFRIFGSEPVHIIERNLRINTCERCFGPYHTAKCTSASVCKDCGTPSTNHRDICKPVP